MGKLTEQEIQVRPDLVDEANLAMATMDRILAVIRQAGSEKRSLEALKKLRQTP